MNNKAAVDFRPRLSSEATSPNAFPYRMGNSSRKSTGGDSGNIVTLCDLADATTDRYGPMRPQGIGKLSRVQHEKIMSTVALVSKISRVSRGRFARLKSSILIYALLFVVVFSLLIWPLMMLIVGAFKSTSPLQGGGVWSFDGLRAMWVDINETNALTTSTTFAGLTTVFGVAMAFVLAFLSERTNCRLQKIITPAVMVCAATSTVFYAIGYSLLANQYTGIADVFFYKIAGVQRLFNVELYGGLVFVESLHSAAFLYLFLIGPLRSLDRSHEEAALVAGASPLTTLMTIDARLLIPILSSVVIVGIVNGLKSFNIPLILGSYANLSFLTVRVLRTLQQYSPPRYNEASALALLLVSLVAVLIPVQYFMIGKRNYASMTGKAYRQARWTLGKFRWAADLFVISYLVLAVFLPLGAIVFSSFLSFPGVYTNLSFQNYVYIFTSSEMPAVVETTLFSIGFGGLAGVSLSFAIAYVTHRANTFVSVALRGATLLQLALPGIVGSFWH